MRAAWLGLGAVAALLFGLVVTPVPLETHVPFARVATDREVAEAVTLLRSLIRTEDDLDAVVPGKEERRPVASHEAYAREFLWIGRGDINNDGVDDRFYVAYERGWCGTAGCATWIVDGRKGADLVYCETSGWEHHFFILPRVTVRGFNEMRSSFPIRWTGSKCFDDDREHDGDVPEPDPIREPWWRRLF